MTQAAAGAKAGSGAGSGSSGGKDGAEWPVLPKDSLPRVPAGEGPVMVGGWVGCM